MFLLNLFDCRAKLFERKFVELNLSNRAHVNQKRFSFLLKRLFQKFKVSVICNTHTHTCTHNTHTLSLSSSFPLHTYVPLSLCRHIYFSIRMQKLREEKRFSKKIETFSRKFLSKGLIEGRFNIRQKVFYVRVLLLFLFILCSYEKQSHNIRS